MLTGLFVAPARVSVTLPVMVPPLAAVIEATTNAVLAEFSTSCPSPDQVRVAPAGTADRVRTTVPAGASAATVGFAVEAVMAGRVAVTGTLTTALTGLFVAPARVSVMIAVRVAPGLRAPLPTTTEVFPPFRASRLSPAMVRVAPAGTGGSEATRVPCAA